MTKVATKGRFALRSPKVPAIARSHARKDHDGNLREWTITQKWQIMKATPYEGCPRLPPKVPEGQETRDPSRSIQVGLSNLGKLPNTPIVISKPSWGLEGHFWNDVIRLGV